MWLLTAAVALLDLRGRLFERIRQQLKQWPMPPAAAAVFGSAARGDGDPASDIDVLVVRPENVDETDRLWAGAVDDLARSILSGQETVQVSSKSPQLKSPT